MQKEESHIVRVNALQGLFNLLSQQPAWEKDFVAVITQIEKENIPSINARIKKIRKGGTRIQAAL
jgi:hypothetical protein